MKSAYHHYCLNKIYSGEFQDRYERISLLYQKKQRAYEEGEIAKTELLQIELEKRTLENQLENFMEQVNDEKEALLSLTSFQNRDNISCRDIYPLKADFNEGKDAFGLTQEAYEKRMHSTQASLKRYSQKIESVEISTGYLRETERDVYTVGISIPLNFTTHKSEYERASLMHQSSSLTLQNEQVKMEKNHEIAKLKSKLRRAYQAIMTQKENIDSFKANLLPLMKKSYDYGESTVVEYLLSQQQLSQKETELLAKKQGYYETLFTLYTISEKR
jgi:outer membrane protein TolC